MQSRAVEFANKHNVRFEVRNSYNNNPGTIVKADTTLEDVVVRGVACDKNQTKVVVSELPDQPGAAAKVFQSLSDASVNVDMIVQNISEDGRTDMTFSLPVNQVARARAAMEAVKEKGEVNYADLVTDEDFTNRAFLNDGTGTFFDPTRRDLPPYSDEQALAAVADVTGDGFPDVVLAELIDTALVDEPLVPVMNDLAAKGVVDDATRLLFAGYRASDTWIWDGRTWTRIDPPAAPGARQLHAMATDASCRMSGSLSCSCTLSISVATLSSFLTSLVAAARVSRASASSSSAAPRSRGSDRPRPAGTAAPIRRRAPSGRSRRRPSPPLWHPPGPAGRRNGRRAPAWRHRRPWRSRRSVPSRHPSPPWRRRGRDSSG